MATVPGRYLIIDMLADPPSVVQTNDILTAVLAERLDAIEAKINLILAAEADIEATEEQIMTAQAEGQAMIQTLADGITAVGSHVTASRDMLAKFIADNQAAPLDFTPALNALASASAAADTLDSLGQQAPQAGGDQPLPDPVPAPPDPATDPTTPIDDPGTPDLPPASDLPPDVQPIDPGTAADTTTGAGDTATGGVVGDTGGATDTTGVVPDQPVDPTVQN